MVWRMDSSFGLISVRWGVDRGGGGGEGDGDRGTRERGEGRGDGREELRGGGERGLTHETTAPIVSVVARRLHAMRVWESGSRSGVGWCWCWLWWTGTCVSVEA